MRCALLIAMLAGCATPVVAPRAIAPEPVRFLRAPHIQFFLPIPEAGLIWVSMEPGQEKPHQKQFAQIAALMKQHCPGKTFFVGQDGLIGDGCTYFVTFECITWEEHRKNQEMLRRMGELIDEGKKLMEQEQRQREKR